jgi:hypothetical protein
MKYNNICTLFLLSFVSISLIGMNLPDSIATADQNKLAKDFHNMLSAFEVIQQHQGKKSFSLESKNKQKNLLAVMRDALRDCTFEKQGAMHYSVSSYMNRANINKDWLLELSKKNKSITIKVLADLMIERLNLFWKKDICKGK